MIFVCPVCKVDTTNFAYSFQSVMVCDCSLLLLYTKKGPDGLNGERYLQDIIFNEGGDFTILIEIRDGINESKRIFMNEEKFETSDDNLYEMIMKEIEYKTAEWILRK